jgi:DNA/RNA endonuclease G (NUC1)
MAESLRSATAKGRVENLHRSKFGVKDAPVREWEDIEDQVLHLADFEGKMVHAQLTGSGHGVVSMHVPASYFDRVVKVLTTAKQNRVYLRIYMAPIPSGSDSEPTEDYIPTALLEQYGHKDSIHRPGRIQVK